MPIKRCLCPILPFSVPLTFSTTVSPLSWLYVREGQRQRKSSISESGCGRVRGASPRIVYTHCPIVWKVGRRRCGLPIKLDLLRVRSIGSTAAVQIHGNHEIFRAHNPVSFPQTDCCYIFRGNADRRYAPDTLHNIGYGPPMPRCNLLDRSNRAIYMNNRCEGLETYICLCV